MYSLENLPFLNLKNIFIHFNLLNNYNLNLLNSSFYTVINYAKLPLNLQTYYTIYWIELNFKISITMYLILTTILLVNFKNYITQQKTIISLTRLFILNAVEKEIGPVDDYFFFVFLFLLTISLFVISTIFIIILQFNMFNLLLGAFLLLVFLILTIPVNLFIDFGIFFCTVIKGSASTNNILKELVFDIISTLTVFIRFIIQNIRFFFIFSGIFELMEWVFSANSNFFITSNLYNGNLFTNTTIMGSFFSLKNFNFVFINVLLFIILYFYYILHLLFLLLVQITIYIGISLWLFFFLYSTKFLTKYEKYFIFKKIN